MPGAAEMLRQRVGPTYPQEVTPATQMVPPLKLGPKFTVAVVPVPLMDTPGLEELQI
jgi:hypothetical protein